MDFEKLCKKVLEIDPKIRFAGAINEKGRLFAGGMRDGLKSLEDSKDDVGHFQVGKTLQETNVGNSLIIPFSIDFHETRSFFEKSRN